jgi:sialate O-acetylesterase
MKTTHYGRASASGSAGVLPDFVPRLLTAGIMFVVVRTAQADIQLPHIFSDHMVLQKAAKVPVWGKAEPGESVTVSLAGVKGQATASAQGKWRLDMDLSKAGAGPFQMTVDGKNHLEIADVVLGEVWVCSGQSNMEFPLSRALDAESEMAHSASPMLRQFRVRRKTSATPMDDCEGVWQTAAPDTSGGFSAVAYFFGKTLQNKLGKPVGLITAAVGDTPVEAWTSYESLSRDPELKVGADRLIVNFKLFPERSQAYARDFPAWLKKYGREDKPVDPMPFLQTADYSGWKMVSLPGTLAAAGFPSSGAVWLVKRFKFPEGQVPKDIDLGLGKPDGWETVYWNGTRIGGRKPNDIAADRAPAIYKVPALLVKPGENTLAVRLFNATGTLGIPTRFPYAGDWLAKMETELPALTPEAQAAMPVAPPAAEDIKKRGGWLFNGMISPLIPYGIKGVTWYQGETNADRAVQYKTAFPLMIRDWRSRWGEGDFPFVFCQLANYNAKPKNPGESNWAELREAQSTALTLPNTGQAVLIDIGEAAEIHPRNKKDAGERLAAWAFARAYGQNVPAEGPVFESMKAEGQTIRVRFKPGPGGLVARPVPATHVVSSLQGLTEPLVRNSPNSQLEGFAICGEDKAWVWADARIDGDYVIVSSSRVLAPIAVRYGWAKNPTCNLYNGAGLPASPFRTDQFPLSTANQKFGES